MKLIQALLALSALASFSSCETTGDPTQGGLFGWSEHKAVGRQVELENRLSDVQADTEEQQARSRRLERKKEQLESQQ
jgi:hypothetical protein